MSTEMTSAPDNTRPGSRSTTGDLLSLVERLADFERIGVTPLARELGVPVATVYRMLRALERGGYVEQLQSCKEYRLTLKLFELGCQVASRTTVRDMAAVELERLALQTGMTTNLGVLVGRDVLYMSKIETDELVMLNLPPGSRVPATCTAMGKAMLAFHIAPVASVVGSGPYPTRTQYSVTDLSALEDNLAEIRQAGYSMDRQELALGLWCVAAPILRGREGQAGAVSVAAYRPTIEEAHLRKLGEQVMACAGRISRRVAELDGHGYLTGIRDLSR